MRIVVAGAGPAGLCFAMCMKARRPSAVISVFDRRPSDQTYGWGITLPAATVSALEPVNRDAAASIVQSSASWRHVHIWHHGRRVEITGTSLLGIERLELLRILAARCRAMDVELRFDTAVDPTSPQDADLFVAADGARSSHRAARPRAFKTSAREGHNRYVWLGTPHRFDGLAFCLAESEHGPFVGHGYPMSNEASTFIVECGNQTWERARFAERSSEDAAAYLARVFADALDGHGLQFHHALRWSRFLHVANDAWHDARMVLIGDAAHSLHFSVGSGTMLAIEDALFLSDCLAEAPTITEAVIAFEDARKPVIDSYLALEELTVGRLERLDTLVPLEPLQLAFTLLSR